MVNNAYLFLVYFLISVPNILQIYHSADNARDQTESNTKLSYIRNETETFDFIIIGGGSAGATIANRLSKNKGTSVLLLERGGDPTPLSSIPYLWLYLARTDKGSFARYTTVPQTPYALATNGVVTLIGGKVLGGTSTLNMMVYTRGNQGVYNEWASITGDSNWSYDSVLPFFKKIENYHGTFSSPIDTKYHSTHGDIYVETANLVQPSATTFFNAIREKNLPIKDLNAHQTTGFQPIDFNSKHGHRFGTFEAFLKPILGRSNLNIYRYSTATKIHLDESKKAYGVTYTRHGQTRFVRARKEIIVCAGVFESPKLLMLSGIGPKQDLISVGITPLIDLPVGKGLRDHLAVSIQVNLNKNITFVPERDFTEQTEASYLLDGSGPIHNVFGTLGYISTVENNDNNWPDIQYFISHQTDPGTDPTAASTIRPDSNTISVYLVRPKSEPGQIKLSGADPTSDLIINPNYATNPSDLQRLSEGVRFIVDLYENSTAYSQIGAKLSDANFPTSCKSLEYRSQPYWDCVLQFLGNSGFHFTGTCSMNSVVDSKLRVLGTSGLRVADTSIMPTLPNCNTNVPAIMVGERVSDFILRRWGLIPIYDILLPGIG